LASLLKVKIALLNVATGLAGYMLAGGGFYGLAPFILAGFLAASGSGAVNHYLDRDIDARMRRTANRPVPAGRVKPATALAIGLSMIGASILVSITFLNILATFFIALGSFIYLIVYTIWLKRRTVWNVVIGGAAGSCPPLAGWAAATNTIDLTPALLALLIFLWTPGHFWGLAIRSSEDYKRVGIPMLPAVVGVNKASVITGASNMLMITTWPILGLTTQNPVVFFLITTPLTILLLKDSIRLMLKADKETAWKVFKLSNPWLLFITIALIIHPLINS